MRRRRACGLLAEMSGEGLHSMDVVVAGCQDLGRPGGTSMCCVAIKGYVQSPIEGESFAAALTDASVPGKETQFYAMLGQRSIYHRGWLACSVHPPLAGWGNFEHDEWELYHLETDRAQANDLAAQEPARLEQLRFYYAGIYNGLPLDDRTALEQALADRPRAAAPRDQYVFYPNCSDAPEDAGPADTPAAADLPTP